MQKKNTSAPNSETLHTINNCLSAINLTAEALSEELYGELNAEQKKHLKGVLLQTKKIANLLKK